MATTPPFDWETIARYLAEESPVEEREAVRRWLDAHTHDAELLRALHATADRAAAPSSVAPLAVDVDAAWERVAASTRPLRIVPRHAAPLLSPWRRPLFRAAAAATLVAAGALGWVATRGRAAERHYVTTVGERDSVRLPDGSTALLAPNSRLDVGAGYGRGAREVALVGEAFFDVRHDAERPFVVRAAGATVRDLGTTFTVRTDAPAVTPGDTAVARVRVAVRSGAARLDAADRRGAPGVVLRAGDVGAVTAAGTVVARPGASTDDDVAWTRGQLVFRHAPVDVVRAELRRWYGVELRIADTVVAGRHLVATFTDEPLDRVLRVIALALGARVERAGSIVMLSSPTTPVRSPSRP